MNKKYIVKLNKASTYSYSIVIPKEIVEKYGWKEHQKIVVADNGNGKVEIKDWQKK